MPEQERLTDCYRGTNQHVDKPTEQQRDLSRGKDGLGLGLELGTGQLMAQTPLCGHQDALGGENVERAQN